MAEEIETPGEGQIRAMVTVAGNPVLSTPDSRPPRRRLRPLDFMVAIDIYLNETTRHADVILPRRRRCRRATTTSLCSSSPSATWPTTAGPVLPLDDGQPDEWEILCQLGMIVQGAGPRRRPAVVDDLTIDRMVESAVGDEHGPVHGRDAGELLAALAPRTGPERILDFMLRTGPYGDGFGQRARRPDPRRPRARTPTASTSARSSPACPRSLRTPDGMIDLAPEDPGRRRGRPARAGPRRPPPTACCWSAGAHLRSNNSWMHNVEVLVKGKPRCTLQVHPDDAAARGLADGDRRRGALAGSARWWRRSRSPTRHGRAW